MADADAQPTTTAPLSQYALSLTLLSDGEPVRSLCHVPPPKAEAAATTAASADAAEGTAAGNNQNNDGGGGYQLISGSQSGILTSHTLLPTTSFLQPTTSIQPGGDGTRHSHQITALLSIPSKDFADTAASLGGGYVSGCKDSLIRVFDSEHNLVNELRGHGNAVTSLSWLYLSGGGDVPPLLISGSWDGSAKLWNLVTGTCLATMDNHENTVSVVGLPPPSPTGGGSALTGRLATTSAGIAQGQTISNHRVRIFTVTLPSPSSPVAQTSLVHTVSNDHSGPIRAVSYDPETDHIVTASNDGTVKVRDGSTGECVTTLVHPTSPMLLSVACLGGGKIVATSEDGTAVVFVTYGSDGEQQPQVLDHPGCVWTVLPLPNGADFATASQDGHIRIWTLDPTRKADDDQIAALAAAVSDSKAKTAGGPSPEEIAKLIKWEMAGLNQGRSEGQVQVFNKGGKAIAAQWSATSGTWIEVGEVTGSNENAGTINGVKFDHVFPIEIDVAGGGVQKLQIGYNNGENPFVVAQKFIDDYELDQNYLSQIADYIQSRVGEQGPTLGGGGGGGGGAAATGGGGSSSGPAPMDVTPPTPQYAHLPYRGYTTFATGTDPKVLTKVLTKVREFNSTLTTNLTDSQVNQTLDDLTSTLSGTSRYHSTVVSDAELAVLEKMVRLWDAERCFPAIDLARLTVLHPDAARGDRGNYWTEIIGLALDKCRIVTEDKLEGTAGVAVPMLTLRLCANCFKGGSGSLAAVAGQLKGVLECAESFATSSNKNVRLAVATVVLNASSYMMSSGGSGGSSASPEHILSVVGSIIGSGLYETEATVRSLVALGTALLADQQHQGGAGTAKEKAKSLHVESMVQHAGSQHGDKAKAVAEEIRLILQG